MDDKRYRVVPPLEGIQPLSALLERIYTEMPSDTPDHPTCYEGEWACPHTLCPTRAIRVRVKAHFYKHLPRLRCPLCLRQLDFRCWLTIVALQEVPPQAPLDGASLAPCIKRGGVRCRKRKPALGADAASTS